MSYPSPDHHIDTHSREYYGFASSEGGGLNTSSRKYSCKAQDQINNDYQKYLESLTPEKRKEIEEYHAKWETSNRYRYDYYQ